MPNLIFTFLWTGADSPLCYLLPVDIMLIFLLHQPNYQQRLLMRLWEHWKAKIFWVWLPVCLPYFLHMPLTLIQNKRSFYTLTTVYCHSSAVWPIYTTISTSKLECRRQSCCLASKAEIIDLSWRDESGWYGFILAYARFMLNLLCAGVLHEFSFNCLKDSDQQWICNVHFFDNVYYLILCCTYAQAKAFTFVKAIKMDLSFKMIQGKTNVYSVSAWNEAEHCKYNMFFAYPRE